MRTDSGAAASLRHRRNREQARARIRAWYLANRATQIDRSRQWRRANPELHQLQNASRRARLMSGRSTSIEHRKVIEGLPRECAYCGRSDVTLTVDHRIALSRGGSHELTNLEWACGLCNSRKAARDELEFRALLALERFIMGRQRIEEASAAWRYGGVSFDESFIGQAFPVILEAIATAPEPHDSSPVSPSHISASV